MRKSLICLLTAATLVLTACTAAPSESAAPETTPEATPAEETVSEETVAEETPAPEEAAPAEETAAPEDLYATYVTEFPDVGTLAKPVETDDNRELNLECLLNNEVDQLVYDHYRDELLGDLDASLYLVGENELYQTTVENDVKRVQEGAGMQSYTLHDMHVLTPEEVQGAEQRYLDVIAQYVADYNLTAWTVEAVDVSWTYTEAEEAMGTQLDEGRYMRYFVAGKTADDGDWKLYDMYFDNFMPQE